MSVLINACRADFSLKRQESQAAQDTYSHFNKANLKRPRKSLTGLIDMTFKVTYEPLTFLDNFTGKE